MHRGLECRINAEHPDTFTPSPGTIHAYSVPGGPGVRVDSLAHAECAVSPHYDSLVAKVMAHGRDRQEAIARMRRTLEMSVIEGIHTTIPLHLKILAEPDFAAGRLSTAFMDRYQAESPGREGTLADNFSGKDAGTMISMSISSTMPDAGSAWTRCTTLMPYVDSPRCWQNPRT